MASSIYFLADGQKIICQPGEEPSEFVKVFELPADAVLNSHYYELEGDQLATLTTPNLPAQSIALTERQVTAALDTFALEKDFDSIADACSFKDSSNILWAAEAVRAIKVRDETWEAFYAGRDIPAMTWV